MNVSLTPELEQFVAAKVEGGFYHSASEVVREGLRLLLAQDAERRKYVDSLNHEIEKGLASSRAGRLIPGEEVYQRLLERRKTYKDPI